MAAEGFAVGTGSGGLPVNNPIFTGALGGPLLSVKASSNNIVYADQFAGATADVKIAAALAQACPVGDPNGWPVANGTVDSRGLTGAQTIAATITMPPNCENGSSSPAHSRTARLQTKFTKRGFSRRGTSANQAVPSNTNSVAPQKHSTAKPTQPTASMADRIARNPTETTK